MRWFRSKPLEIEPEVVAAVNRRLDALEAQNRMHQQVLARLEEESRASAKGLKVLEMDWQEWFDKFRLMYARLSRRIKEAAIAVGDGDGAQSRQDALEQARDRAAYGKAHPPLHERADPTRRNY